MELVDVPGIGPKSASKLQIAGVRDAVQLMTKDPSTLPPGLSSKLTRTAGEHVYKCVQDSCLLTLSEEGDDKRTTFDSEEECKDFREDIDELVTGFERYPDTLFSQIANHKNGSLIYTGSDGRKVYRWKMSNSNVHVVLKRIPLEQGAVASLASIANLNIATNGKPHLNSAFVKIYKAVHTDNKSLYLVMESLQGDGEHFMKHFRNDDRYEAWVLEMFRQLFVKGLRETLFGHGFVFNDIKPQNIGYRIVDDVIQWSWLDVECITAYQKTNACMTANYIDVYNISVEEIDQETAEGIEAFKFGLCMLEMAVAALNGEDVRNYEKQKKIFFGEAGGFQAMVKLALNQDSARKMLEDHRAVCLPKIEKTFPKLHNIIELFTDKDYTKRKIVPL